MRVSRKQIERAERNLRIAGYTDVEADGRFTAKEKRDLKALQQARGHKPSGKLDKHTRETLAKMARRIGHGDQFVLGHKSEGIHQAEKQLAAKHLKHGKVDGILDKKSLSGMKHEIRRQRSDRFDVNAYDQAYQQQLSPFGPMPSPAEASQDAEQILNGVHYRDQQSGVDAVLDPNDVNDASDTANGSARHQAALQALSRNYGLEQGSLKRLSPQDQGAYQAVRQQLDAANDPVAALALQKLLFDGKFSGALAGQLGSVANGSAQLAPTVSRGAFLSDLVQECAVPAAIAQGPNTGSCGPTALEQDLATKDPAEYARLAIGIASPEGRVQLKGGMELQRPPGTESDDGSGRSTVQRMLGSAMYEVSNGDAQYQGPFDMQGSWGYALADLRSQVEGKPEKFAVLTSEANNGPAMQGIAQMLQSGQRPLVQLAYGPQGGRHYLCVTGRGSDANGPYVEMLNPAGRLERMSERDFMARLYEVHYDPSVVDPSTASQMGFDGSQQA